MVSVSTWLVAAALMVPANVEVVNFTATWCAPCQTLKPTLEQLAQQGIRVTSVDVDRQADLARQYQVTSVPTLLLVVGGNVVDRIEGAVAPDELQTRLRKAQPAIANRQPRRELAGQTTAPTRRRQPKNRNLDPQEQMAREATVRLRVEDDRGQSFGTGTIVHLHGRDALILTCGHIFRDSKGKGRITVDLSLPEATEPIDAQLIRFDLERDLALVGIRTNASVRPISIAGPGYHVATGQRLFSMGCDRGKRPSVLRGHLKAVNKYLGPENLVVSGRPIDGRSGGGLFTYDGRLVGVCNAADQEIDEGLYAAFASIHRHLDEAKLAFVYRESGGNEPAGQIARATAPRESRGSERRGSQDRGVRSTRGDRQTRPIEDRAVAPAGWDQPRLATGRQRDRSTADSDQARRRLAELLPESQSNRRGLAASAAGDAPEDAEVICIIRAKGDSGKASEVVVLDRPSRDFIQTLNREHERQQNRQTTQSRIERYRR